MASRDEVLKLLKCKQKVWRRGRVLWSMAYHGFGLGALAAAFLTTLGTSLSWRNGLNVALASVTTALTASTALFRPANKWRANRISYFEAELIRMDLMKDGYSPDMALERLESLLIKHNLAILGGVGVDRGAPK